MAKNATRVNGRHGERMWLEDGIVRFKSQNETYEFPIGEFERFDILNVEEARGLVEQSRDLAGEWTKEQKSPNAKSLLLVGAGRGFCWVMEVTKSQGPTAISFARGICPSGSKEEEAREYKLYAAIQTPRGGLCAVGSIACAFLAYYFVGIAKIAIVGLLCAALSIFLFTRVK